MTKILGIDPSLAATGIVYLEDGKIAGQKLVKSKPTGTNKIKEIKRFESIGDEIPILGVKLIVLEGLAFMARNTTALIQLAGLNYFLRMSAFKLGIPFVVVAPTTLKKFITGKGVGQKDLIMLEIYKHYKVTIKDNNVADAFVLAKIGEALLDPNIKLTKYQQEVISLLKPQLNDYENYKKEQETIQKNSQKGS